MNCCKGSHHHGHEVHGKDCCHDSVQFFQRHYISPAEEKERLEKYKIELQKEIEGVEARISELSS